VLKVEFPDLFKTGFSEHALFLEVYFSEHALFLEVYFSERSSAAPAACTK
jgi:hypothetical protein